MVWESDITYLRMEHGFMYLVAIIDVYSRFVVAWSIIVGAMAIEGNTPLTGKHRNHSWIR